MTILLLFIMGMMSRGIYHHKSTVSANNVLNSSEVKSRSDSLNVSRSETRSALNTNYWGGLGTMSVPYSQSTSEKEVMSELKKRTSSANDLYSSSSGKVDDESTRTALRKSITTADDIISATTLTTKPNVQSVNDAIDAISNTMNSVRKSISSRNASESSPSTPSGDIQKYAKSLLSDYGWDDGEWDSVDYIVTHESGWDPASLNPSSGAIGLFQCLGHPECSAIAYKTDYKVQVKWGLNYIRNRYGTPTSAATFWNAHNWY